MKKFILTFICLFIPCFSISSEMSLNINEYLNKQYIGMPYNQALQQEIPFLLIFANPNNIISIVKLSSVGEIIYNEFKGQYNFCIINSKSKENQKLIDVFRYKNLPALFIIDTNQRTYLYIDKKYYKKQELRKILTEFKKGTL